MTACDWGIKQPIIGTSHGGRILNELRPCKIGVFLNMYCIFFCGRSYQFSVLSGALRIGYANSRALPTEQKIVLDVNFRNRGSLVIC